jgi:hypothetical protein
MEDGRQAGERRFQKPASSFLREQRPDWVAARLNNLTPATGERHEEANMAVIDR